MVTDTHNPWDPNDQRSPGGEKWLSFKTPASIAALVTVLQQGRVA